MAYAYKNEISQMQCEKKYPNPEKKGSNPFLGKYRNIHSHSVIFQKLITGNKILCLSEKRAGIVLRQHCVKSPRT